MNGRTLRTLLAAVAGLAGCDTGRPFTPGTPAALVTFVFDAHPEDTLVVQVAVASTIDAAERYIAAERGANIPAGRIRRGAGADPRYPFHFLPDSVRLVEVAMELCDGAPMRTPEAVLEFMRGATGETDPVSAPWCPWGARPIRVVRMGSD